MQKLSGLEYLKIDVCNCWGNDKGTWSDRLYWFNKNEPYLEELVIKADKKILYAKAVKAYRQVMQGKPVGHMMYLDATASGPQLMAALSGCRKTAHATNMLDPTVRIDIYSIAVNGMNEYLDYNEEVDRSMVKMPLISHYFNKGEQETLTERQQDAFYTVLDDKFPGAELVKETATVHWDYSAKSHTLIYPDGHTAFLPVTEYANTRIEIDELNHAKITLRHKINKPSVNSSSLTANIIHSTDAYVAREMIRRCHTVNVQVCPIHDAFASHCNDMNVVRQTYIDIIAEIAKADFLNDLLVQLGSEEKFINLSNDLHLDILNSEYMLC